MWLELAIEVLWPSGRTRPSKPAERDPDLIPVEFARPDAFTRGLNESRWLEDEVVAAGLLRQGAAPSLVAMLTGAALIEVVRRRRCRALPREFALAVTADRVFAFAMSPWKEGEGETVRVVKIKRDERGSWPRSSVRLIGRPGRLGMEQGTLEIAGLAPFPVTWAGEPDTSELAELLGT